MDKTDKAQDVSNVKASDLCSWEYDGFLKTLHIPHPNDPLDQVLNVYPLFIVTPSLRSCLSA